MHLNKSLFYLRESFKFFFFSLQFFVDGNSIVLSPELYITVLAYTSILNPEAPQVGFICNCQLPLLMFKESSSLASFSSQSQILCIARLPF